VGYKARKRAKDQVTPPCGVELATRGCAPRNRLRPIPHRWNFDLTINRTRPSAQRKRPEAAKSGLW